MYIVSRWLQVKVDPPSYLRSFDRIFFYIHPSLYDVRNCGRTFDTILCGVADDGEGSDKIRRVGYSWVLAAVNRYIYMPNILYCVYPTYAHCYIIRPNGSEILRFGPQFSEQFVTPPPHRRVYVPIYNNNMTSYK